jgi:hypothetical protein
MAVKDVHLALVQRASSAKELWGQSQASSRASGYARRLQLRAEHLHQDSGSRCRRTSLVCTLSTMN